MTICLFEVIDKFIFAAFPLIMLVLLVVLLFCSFASSTNEENCNKFCSLQFVGNGKDACRKGCADKIESGFSLSLDGINTKCQIKCESLYAINELKAACYDGCSFIEPTAVNPDISNYARNQLGLPSFFNNDFIQRMFSLMNFVNTDQIVPDTDGEPVVQRIRIRVFVPESGDALPIENTVYQNMNGIGYTTRQKFNTFIHHIRARPLFYATVLFVILNVIILLTFCIIRLRINRLNKKAHQRQMEKILPAFFGPAAWKINLTSPQPFTEDQADALPPKEPIV